MASGRRAAVGAASAVLALAACSTPERTEPAGLGDEKPKAVEAIDLASVQGRWWTWAESEPRGTDPVSDRTGAACHVNQPDDLWFVAGTYGTTEERTCTVPAGRSLVGPAANQVSDDPADCRAFLASAQGSVTLDGQDVALERVEPTEITVTGVDGNSLTGEGGAFTAHGCGLWFKAQPPTPGKHELVIKGGSGDFAVQATYHLVVGDRS